MLLSVRRWHRLSTAIPVCFHHSIDSIGSAGRQGDAASYCLLLLRSIRVLLRVWLAQRLSVPLCILSTCGVLCHWHFSFRRWLRGRHRFSNRLRSEEHTSELQSRQYLVCRLL